MSNNGTGDSAFIAGLVEGFKERLSQPQVNNFQLVLGEPEFATIPKGSAGDADLVMKAIKLGLREQVKGFFGPCEVLIPDQETSNVRKATEAETIGLMLLLLEQAGGDYQAAKQVVQARIIH